MGTNCSMTEGTTKKLALRLLHVARDISLFLSASGGPAAARGVIERRSGGTFEPQLADLAVQPPGRHPRRPGRDADVGAGARRAVPAGPDRGRTGRCRVRGDRRAHRSQVAVATGAFDGCGRVAEAAAWRMGLPPIRHTRAAGRAGLRRRPDREPNAIWKSRPPRVRRMGAGPTPLYYPERASPSRRRSLRSGCSPGPTTNGSTDPATTAAPVVRRSNRRPRSSPRPTARGHARRRP